MNTAKAISTAVVDTEEGIAKEVGTWTLNGESDQVIGAVTVTVENDDQLCFSFGEVILMVPAERIRAIIGGKP